MENLNICYNIYRKGGKSLGLSEVSKTHLQVNPVAPVEPVRNEGRYSKNAHQLTTSSIAYLATREIARVATTHELAIEEDPDVLDANPFVRTDTQTRRNRLSGRVVKEEKKDSRSLKTFQNVFGKHSKSSDSSLSRYSTMVSFTEHHINL